MVVRKKTEGLLFRFEPSVFNLIAAVATNSGIKSSLFVGIRLCVCTEGIAIRHAFATRAFSVENRKGNNPGALVGLGLSFYKVWLIPFGMMLLRNQSLAKLSINNSFFGMFLSWILIWAIQRTFCLMLSKIETKSFYIKKVCFILLTSFPRFGLMLSTFCSVGIMDSSVHFGGIFQVLHISSQPIYSQRGMISVTVGDPFPS